MGRFKIRVKLQGLEMDIDGSRDDAPLIASNLGRQFAGLLEPAAHIVEGTVEVEGDDNSTRVAVLDEPAARSRSSRRGKRTGPPRTNANGAAGISWKHDPSKWGNPQQGWSAADKAVWLLYVSGQETQVKDMASSTLASAFNRMFREAGMVRAGNLPRDLGRLKAQAPPLVGEDTTKTPPTWFLTIEGTKKAEELVKQARGQSQPAS
jgi:hypothetical protein